MVEVPSPCINVCELNADQVCTGCGRTIDEIARWMEMTDDERRTVLARLARLTESATRNGDST